MTGSAFATAAQREARCGCVKWYAKDVAEAWEAPDTPCPCTRVQADNDGRFVASVEQYFDLTNAFEANFTTTSTEPWEYDTCKLKLVLERLYLSIHVIEFNPILHRG